MRLPFAVLVCHLILAASACAEFPLHRAHLGGDPNSPFNMGLQRVLQRHFARDTTEEKLEEDYLSLLELATSAEQEGLVYAHIAWMYCTKGTIRAPQVAETYCQEALGYPLPVDVAASMHNFRGMALWTRYHQEWRGERYRVARRRIIAPALAGLKLVMENGAPREAVPLPTVVIDNTFIPMGAPGREEALQEIARRHAAQLAERRKAELLNVLQRFREWFIRSCVNLYLQDPADPDELRRLASEALADHPEARADLLDQLAAAVAKER